MEWTIWLAFGTVKSYGVAVIDLNSMGAHLERINDVCFLGRRYAERDKGRDRFQTQMNAYCSTPL